MPDSSKFIWLFFRVSGRVSRMAYFLAALMLAIIPAFFLYRFLLLADGEMPPPGTGAMWALGFWVTFLASVWSNVVLGVKRIHDFGKPGILAVSLFIPVISILAFIVLCIVPGDPGPNEYGQRTNAPD